MPTIQDVVKAFDAFGDKYVQSGALISRLRQAGFDDAAASKAVDDAIGAGVLAWTEMRSLYRPD